MRRCGRPNCACADPEHPGRGPQHVLTKNVASKTVRCTCGPVPSWTRRASRTANYKRFRQIVDELIEVNEAICQARPVSPLAERASGEKDRGGVRNTDLRWEACLSSDGSFAEADGPSLQELCLVREQQRTA